MDYLNQVTALTEKALQAIGVSLGYDESYFDEICTEPMAFYKLLQYPPQPADADPLQRGIGAHRDFGSRCCYRGCPRAGGVGRGVAVILPCATNRGGICGAPRESFPAVDE
ncbi:hypothetical protein V6Z88_009454 [Aspergillus fumigatus]